MAELMVHCYHCRQPFSVPEGSEGESFDCPHCRARNLIPQRKPTSADADAALQRRCPNCQASMPAHAVFCIRCGFDLRTKTTYHDLARKNLLMQRLLSALGVLIAIGLVVTFVRRPAPEPVAPAPLAAPPLLPAESPAETAPQAAPPPAVDEAPAPAPQEFAEEPPPSPEPEETALPLEELRSTLAAELDRREPLYRSGEAVVLYRTSGQVHRGAFAGITGEEVILRVGDLESRVPLQALDRRTRARVDPEYRQRLIDARAEQLRDGREGTIRGPR